MRIENKWCYGKNEKGRKKYYIIMIMRAFSEVVLWPNNKDIDCYQDTSFQKRSPHQKYARYVGLSIVSGDQG